MKKIFSIIVLAIVANSVSFAQQNLTLYNLKSVPQAMQVNPSQNPNCRFYVGGGLIPATPTPFFPSLYFSKASNGPRMVDLIKKDGDGVEIDFANAIKKAAKNNYFNFNTQIDWLDFGFKLKRNYFTFTALTKLNFRLSYPKDFLNFLYLGNADDQNLNKPLNFNFGVDAIAYHEAALGYNREVLEDKLWIGGRLKYLRGIANIQTVRSDAILTTSDTVYELTGKIDALVNTSGFDSTSLNDPLKLIMGANTGYAIDLGATYKLNDKITVSGSVIDLGFINWTNGVTNYKANGYARFEGLDWVKVMQDSGGINTAFEKATDTLGGIFSSSTTHDSYKTWLNNQFYLSGTYSLGTNYKAGAMLYNQMFNKKAHLGGGLSFTAQVGQWINATATYSIVNRSYANIGLGMALNIFAFQFYAVTDNILGLMVMQKYGATNAKGEYKGFMYPGSSKNVNIRFGANWTFGRKSKDKDKDGILDKKDECPDVKGLPEFNGCPDKDGDKIPDKDDKCPDVAGPADTKGCPDKDGDTILDDDDACPDEAGVKETKGCPDKDADGVKDSEDKCPDLAGLSNLAGCPDKDADGITDAEDACPDIAGTKEGEGCPDADKDGIYDNKDLCKDVAGPKENNGCPYKDTDNDGVLDKDDKCPDQAGPKENKGCPIGDADGDGIPDPQDNCPNVAGVKENKGCPELKKEEQEILNTAFTALEFELGKAILKETSFDELNELAGLLKKKSDWKLVISGHTDNVGDPKKNLKLSQDRALAVKNYLIAKGIEGARLTSEGFGDKKPLASNKTPDGRMHNRRVEMKVLFE